MLYRLMHERYHFEQLKEGIYFVSHDENHEGVRSMDAKEKSQLVDNLKRLLNALTCG